MIAKCLYRVIYYNCSSQVSTQSLEILHIQYLSLHALIPTLQQAAIVINLKAGFSVKTMAKVFWVGVNAIKNQVSIGWL